MVRHPFATRRVVVGMLVAFACGRTLADDSTIKPFPRERLPTQTVHAWSFDAGAEGWAAVHDCALTASDGHLTVKCNGDDPYLASPLLSAAIEGPLWARLRVQSSGSGRGQIFWATRESPHSSESHSTSFALKHDGQWHEYEVLLDFAGPLLQLRLDPGQAPGEVLIDRLELAPARLHPLEIEKVASTDREIRVGIRNHSDQPLDVSALGKSLQVPGRSIRDLIVDAAGRVPFESYRLEIQSPGLPPLERSVFVHRETVEADWIVRQSGNLTLQVAKDGTGVRCFEAGKLVAVMGPLAERDGVALKLSGAPAADALEFAGEGITVAIRLSASELTIAVDAQQPCEGPVLRPLGGLEQGLFCGLEFLGRGESSSSTLDVETIEHLRFAPDPLKVTMPLMVCRTERTTAAMTWQDMQLQPVFAAPNFLDGAPGHRMALRGKHIEATIRLQATSLEDAILWGVQKHGLPPLPTPPRSPEDQAGFCLKALNGPLRNAEGWGHCAEPNWGRQPYADTASTLYRLTGQAPDLPRIVPGGAHVRNDAIYFVTGRAEEWKRIRAEESRHLIQQQQADGSYRYQGPYLRGHFENTASGFEAQWTVRLLDNAWLTGDRAALEAGLKSLEHMKRFRTPRGAQTWELSLHTPDILAAAHLVGAYVRGYQLTGSDDYLAQARRWAICGIPFVYLWGREPIMPYATIAVYGSTNWRAPNWIGLPVQWCGGVYAYRLVELARYDHSLDWKRLAEGILIAGEQMQYPDGDFAGCLPDSLTLGAQQRNGPAINPCALLSLRWALAGRPDGLAVAHDDRHRVVAPFPLTIQQGKAVVQARPGANYQLLIDGQRVVEVHSTGQDTIALD